MFKNDNLWDKNGCDQGHEIKNGLVFVLFDVLISNLEIITKSYNKGLIKKEGDNEIMGYGSKGKRVE